MVCPSSSIFISGFICLVLRELAILECDDSGDLEGCEFEDLKGRESKGLKGSEFEGLKGCESEVGG